MAEKKGVGRPPILKNRELNGFYAVLDAALPSIVTGVLVTFKRASEEAEKAEGVQDKLAWHKLKIDAAKVLLGKAPDRLANADGSNMTVNVIAYGPTDPIKS